MTTNTIAKNYAWFCMLAISLAPIGCNPQDTASSAKSPPAPKPVAVSTSPVIQAEVTPRVTLIGTVTAIKRSTIGSPVEGRVTAMRVEPGDHVGMEAESAGDPPSGQTIAQLDTEPVTIQMAAATAELTRLQHELAELRAGARPEEIAQAAARLAAAKDASKYAQDRLRRIEELAKQNAVSNEQIAALRTAAFAAAQELIGAQAANDLLIAGPRKEKIDQTVAKVSQQEQEVARLEADLRNHTIKTPFTGEVVQKLTEVGQWLTKGAPIAEIISLDPIDVVVHVPESLVTHLQIGDKVDLTFDALPTASRTQSGVIHGIVDSADQKSRTFPVRIRLANPSHNSGYLLRAGMHARATLSGQARSRLMVPKDALILGGPKPVVFIADISSGQTPIAVRVEVETGISHEDHIEVTGDVKAGQQVVVAGNERLRPGQILKVTNGSVGGTTDE